MAGPTAAESLIKAAAAGEGAQEGGGARGKGWKEVAGKHRADAASSEALLAELTEARLGPECGTRSVRSTIVSGL